MSIRKLIDAIDVKFPEPSEMVAAEIMAFIDNYAAENEQEYKKLRANGQLSFGKFRGYSIKELCLTPKGIDYVQWLLSCGWFTEDKYEALHADIKECGVTKKKASKRAPLV